jgi:hypothetical protein
MRRRLSMDLGHAGEKETLALASQMTPCRRLDPAVPDSQTTVRRSASSVLAQRPARFVIRRSDRGARSTIRVKGMTTCILRVKGPKGLYGGPGLRSYFPS